MRNEIMFCPNCGKADQKENSYCRNCGDFLPDLTKRKVRIHSIASIGGDTPEDQIRTSLYLNLLTAIVSLALAIALYVSFYGKDAPQLIYLTAAFLLAMSFWQFSTCFIGLKLRKNFSKRREASAAENESGQSNQFEAAKTKDLLSEADFTNVVPTSVAENTTKILSEKINRESS